MLNVLITDDVHEALIGKLQQSGIAVEYRPDISNREIFEILPSYDGLVINSKTKVDRAMMDRGIKLRFIGRLGSGLDIIDLEYASIRGITVLSTPEANSRAVAEHVLGMMLAAANRFRQGMQEVASMQKWQREACRGFELEGKTIGIIGVGNNGSETVKLLASMGMQILMYDKYRPAGYGAAYPHAVEAGSPDVITERASIISLHVPLTHETENMVNEEFFERWKNPLMLVNISRGRVVDTESLVKALSSGRLPFACLDVLANEKPETYSPEERMNYGYLANHPQVICTPHVAGWTHESKEKIALSLAKSILTKCANEVVLR